MMTIEYLLVNIRIGADANDLIREYVDKGWWVHSLDPGLNWVLFEMDVEADWGDPGDA